MASYNHRSPLAAWVGRRVTITREITTPAGDTYRAGERFVVVRAYRGLTLRLVMTVGERLAAGYPKDERAVEVERVGAECVEEVTR
jgi:hypothetical protein